MRLAKKTEHKILFKGYGYQVTVFDPEGFPVNLLHGQDDGIEDGELEGKKLPSMGCISALYQTPRGRIPGLFQHPEPLMSQLQM